MKLFITVTLSIFLGSCALHSPSLLSLDEGNPDKIVDKAFGISKVTRVLSIGGVNKNALAGEAKDNLIAYRPLVDGESYGNITMDVKRSFYGIFSVTKCFIMADVIHINAEFPNDSKLNNEKSSFFKPGDVVMNQKGQSVEILSIRKKYAMIQRVDKSEFKPKQVSVNRLFKTFGEVYGVEIGQVLPPNNVSGSTSTVLGLGVKKMLVQFDVSKRVAKIGYFGL